MVEHLKSKAVPVDKSEMIKQVAMIAANNDPEIGDLIAEAVDRVGAEGVITVEEAKSLETELSVVEGMQFDKGYVSPYMITDGEKREAVLENPLILITDQTINATQDLIPSLEFAIAKEATIADRGEGRGRAGVGHTRHQHRKQGPQGLRRQGTGLRG